MIIDVFATPKNMESIRPAILEFLNDSEMEIIKDFYPNGNRYHFQVEADSSVCFAIEEFVIDSKFKVKNIGLYGE